MKQLILESYYTGSHKQWADNLKKSLGIQCTLLTLPGKYWKWRMHSSAVEFASTINSTGERFDEIICSSLTNLATLKGLLKPHHDSTSFILYMHENQLVYPHSSNLSLEHIKRDHHYGFINYISCLAADEIHFNSEFHRNSFLKALPDYLNMYPDCNNLDSVKALEDKSLVRYVPLELSHLKSKSKNLSGPPVILWNHRWEHDKGPEEFFNSLIMLSDEGLDFNLIVLGESYNRRPEIFKIAHERLGDKILHWGYCDSKEEYFKLLQRSDILPVTSRHEFFGISAVEAISAGCIPLFPNRLSYPEILGQNYLHHLYEQGEFLSKLRNLISNYHWDNELSTDVIKRFHQNI
ncbi:MAG: DUF3524 domain-containing protein [Flavobacteriales bacterium]|nr:DUF3524 domain-containing protein [Flavobacteriales bacterium]NNK80445.1 DUF3524 domain-containing protein [Flavobacteriales bacterium]